MKKLKIILGILIAIIILMSLNPLRRSPEHIRERMLKITPAGTDKAIVIKTIEDKNWYWHESIKGRGYDLNAAYSPTGKGGVIGDHYIISCIGEYPSPFITSVVVNWVFDADSKLIDVFIEKQTDAL